MLSELAIWYLRKRRKSVIINFRIMGDLQALRENARLCDNKIAQGTKIINASGELYITVNKDVSRDD